MQKALVFQTQNRIMQSAKEYFHPQSYLFNDLNMFTHEMTPFFALQLLLNQCKLHQHWPFRQHHQIVEELE